MLLWVRLSIDPVTKESSGNFKCLVLQATPGRTTAIVASNQYQRLSYLLVDRLLLPKSLYVICESEPIDRVLLYLRRPGLDSNKA